MAHYILADDFDYDSIIIKGITFTFDANSNNKLTLVITYNDDETLTGETNLTDLLTATQCQNLIDASLVSYPTINAMNTAINNALASYDKSSVVDSKVSNAKVDSILFTYNATSNTIDATLTFGDASHEYGSVTIPLSTTTSAGLMSASDKTKLDGIETGANRYVLPIASYGTIGGVKGTAKTDETIPVVIDANGYMWITAGAYTLPKASSTALGGVKANAKVAESTPVVVDADGFMWVTPGAIEIATPTIVGGVRVGGGLMIDSTGLLVNAYDLPTASKTTLGGVKVDGTTITIANGVISANFDTTLYGASLSLTDTTLTLKNTAGTGISSVTLPTGLTKVTKTSFAVGDDMSIFIDHLYDGVITGVIAPGSSGYLTITFDGSHDNWTHVLFNNVQVDLTTKLITTILTCYALKSLTIVY